MSHIAATHDVYPAMYRKPKLKLFSELPLSPELQKRLAAVNFVIPTPVQALAIPPALEGRDVLATAQTGTGKTLSFMLPIIERLQKVPGKQITALILLPTRELAMQVEKVYRQLMPEGRMRAALVVGGLAEGPQLDALRRGVRIVVATPGRLEDYIDRKLVKLDGVEVLVLDECDRMLDMGFKPSIKRIVGKLRAERQTLCYSATLNTEMREVTREYLKNPVRIDISTELKPAENVALQMFEVSKEKKSELLEHLLSKHEGSFLVFTRTKHGADRLANRLSRVGHNAARIHGDRTQAQRVAALKGFADGANRVLVATDVAARGIDVPHVAHVVNYDLPKEAEDFVHRVGRTGRASRSGTAHTFALPEERNEVRRIERKLAITMKRYKVTATVSNKAAVPA
ncbi:MAG: ATP-dependent helicase RhlE [Acidobacteriaceae bacterium]|nr:ATP-dependent helicase RhlE [Acidobacteriaceae bacterium]